MRQGARLQRGENDTRMRVGENVEQGNKSKREENKRRQKLVEKERSLLVVRFVFVSRVTRGSL